MVNSLARAHSGIWPVTVNPNLDWNRLGWIRKSNLELNFVFQRFDQVESSVPNWISGFRLVSRNCIRHVTPSSSVPPAGGHVVYVYREIKALHPIACAKRWRGEFPRGDGRISRWDAFSDDDSNGLLVFARRRRDKHQTIMKRMLRFGRPTAAYSDLQVPYEPLTTLLQVYHVPESKFQHLLNPDRFRRSLGEDT